MILEQNFQKTDLAEIEQIFAMTIKSELLLYKKTKKFLKIRNFILNTCIFLLFGCCIVLIILQDKISKEVIIFLSIGVFFLLLEQMEKMLEGKMNPLINMRSVNIAKRKYGQPFTVIVEEDKIIYKQKCFSYTEIKTVIQYKNILFISTGKVFFVIKVNEEEKEIIFSKMKQNDKISYIHKEEPFDLKQFIKVRGEHR